MRARQSALCTVGVRRKVPIGRLRTLSLSCMDARKYSVNTQVLGEIDEHEFGILLRKWGRL